MQEIPKEIKVQSHSEREIFKGCVAMMQQLMNAFEEYLDWMDVHPDNEEERFSYQFYNTQIVERLFLWNTHHSGGTSQREKCRELGIKDDGTVTFRDEREKDDD